MKPTKATLKEKERLFQVALQSAEREGFEPSVPLPVRQFSKLFLSATQASLLILECKYSNSNYFAKIF